MTSGDCSVSREPFVRCFETDLGYPESIPSKVISGTLDFFLRSSDINSKRFILIIASIKRPITKGWALLGRNFFYFFVDNCKK